MEIKTAATEASEVPVEPEAPPDTADEPAGSAFSFISSADAAASADEAAPAEDGAPSAFGFISQPETADPPSAFDFIDSAPAAPAAAGAAAAPQPEPNAPVAAVAPMRAGEPHSRTAGARSRRVR